MIVRCRTEKKEEAYRFLLFCAVLDAAGEKNHAICCAVAQKNVVVLCISYKKEGEVRYPLQSNENRNTIILIKAAN